MGAGMVRFSTFEALWKRPLGRVGSDMRAFSRQGDRPWYSGVLQEQSILTLAPLANAIAGATPAGPSCAPYDGRTSTAARKFEPGLRMTAIEGRSEASRGDESWTEGRTTRATARNNAQGTQSSHQPQPRPQPQRAGVPHLAVLDLPFPVHPERRGERPDAIGSGQHARGVTNGGHL